MIDRVVLVLAPYPEEKGLQVPMTSPDIPPSKFMAWGVGLGTIRPPGTVPEPEPDMDLTKNGLTIATIGLTFVVIN